MVCRCSSASLVVRRMTTGSVWSCCDNSLGARGDRGYDADWIRAFVTERGAWANIPPKRNRKDPICFSPHLYRDRNLIERFFNKIKQCRRVATRYDELADNYLAWGKFVADLLDKIYPRLEALAANKIISDSSAFCEVKLALGNHFFTLGEQRRDSKKLQEAIDIYREILASSYCTTDKDFVASIHNHLGFALVILGSLENNTLDFRWRHQLVIHLLHRLGHRH